VAGSRKRTIGVSFSGQFQVNQPINLPPQHELALARRSGNLGSIPDMGCGPGLAARPTVFAFQPHPERLQDSPSQHVAGCVLVSVKLPGDEGRVNVRSYAPVFQPLFSVATAKFASSARLRCPSCGSQCSARWQEAAIIATAQGTGLILLLVDLAVSRRLRRRFYNDL